MVYHWNLTGKRTRYLSSESFEKTKDTVKLWIGKVFVVVINEQLVKKPGA